MPAPKPIPFQQFLSQLLDSEHPLDPRYFYRLSDMETGELLQLGKAWEQIPLWRRQAIMEDIEDLSEEDMLLSFVGLASLATSDSDAGVRLHAVRSLWEYEEKSLIQLFLKLSKNDSDPEVRSAATGALGRFVYSGELEELPASTNETILQWLLEVIRGKDLPQVRRSALEALGFSSRDEIPGLIEQAYQSREKEWIASALFAMGRSGDEVWRPKVLAMLEHPAPVVRTEAARAAGELELVDARPLLIELLDDPDENTRFASIWSLSQLGGHGVQARLEAIAEEMDDDKSLEFLESALENLAFTDSMTLMPLLDIDDTEGEDETEDDDYFIDEDLDEDLVD